MPFNSDTYLANKARRWALEALAHARTLKQRIASGLAKDHEMDLVPHHVRTARAYWSIYRTLRPARKRGRR